jgi:hypothetical protein
MDIGGPDNAPTIIILPGALQNRATMTYLFEVLVGTNQYKVINMDLPGLGSRVGEPLNRSTCVEAVKKVIQDQYADHHPSPSHRVSLPLRVVPLAARRFF